MYYEGIEPFLTNLEDKNVGVAGGAVVAMVLSSLNSLIIYISNLTIGKKKYADVEDKVKAIFDEANNLKAKTLQMIDGDKLVLDRILDAYKNAFYLFSDAVNSLHDPAGFFNGDGYRLYANCEVIDKTHPNAVPYAKTLLSVHNLVAFSTDGTAQRLEIPEDVMQHGLATQ